MCLNWPPFSLQNALNIGLLFKIPFIKVDRKKCKQCVKKANPLLHNPFVHIQHIYNHIATRCYNKYCDRNNYEISQWRFMADPDTHLVVASPISNSVFY